jgi:hypothetical protein
MFAISGLLWSDWAMTRNRMWLSIAFLACVGSAGLSLAWSYQQPENPHDPFQVHPVASPQPPKLPKIDEKASPFECCTFRQWTVNRPSVLYNTWRAGRKRIAGLAKGQKVEGLDGVHVTFSPDRVRVIRDVPEAGMKAGDEALRYMYHGEAFAQFWSKGQYYDSLGLSIRGDGSQSGDCFGECDSELILRGKKEWWVQVRTDTGASGWVLADGNFDGMDACG